MTVLAQTLWEILRLVLLVYLVLVVVIFVWQDRILFYPRGVPAANQLAYARFAVEISHQDPSGNAVTLRGWLMKNSKQADLPFIIYYGGNAEEMSDSVADLSRYRASGLLLVNYRGYGSSDGKPSAKALKEDALVIYDWLLKSQQIPSEKIVLLGRSLGSGVAIWVASQREVASVILVSPFDSLSRVGQHHYPWLPVTWLFRHQMDSQALAGKIEKPLLVIVGDQDRVIPNSHSLNLYERWAGDKSLIAVEGADHNSLSLFPEYWQGLNTFLSRKKPL